jgi:hypothetical protein
MNRGIRLEEGTSMKTLPFRAAASRLSLLGITACLLAPACSSSSPSDESEWGQSFDAVIDPNFDRNNLVSDADFTDENALTVQQIQKFLEATPYGNRSALADYSHNGQSAAQAILASAHKNHLNPLAILVRAQMEQSLIGNPSPSSTALNYAFGCGCPDNGSCDPNQKGFDRQVSCMGSWMRGYLEDLAAGKETIAGWKVGKSKQTLDPLSVKPKNQATAALYTYTPWVGESGGGRAGIGGNSAHYNIWKLYAKNLGYQGAGSTPENPSSGGCANDIECNHGALGVGVICSNTGNAATTCIDGCHNDQDCASGSTCNKQAVPHWACTSAPPAIGTPCVGKPSGFCSNNQAGTGRVCSANSGTCIIGCHSEQDCPQNSHCDQSSATWVCTASKALGETCTNDQDCNGGLSGKGVVCGASSHVCLSGCHTNDDCSPSDICDKTGSSWTCKKQSSSPPPSSNGCPVLSFPSGVSLQTKPNASLTQAYQNVAPNDSCYPTPKCFIDVDDLKDPVKNMSYSWTNLQLSAHFSLYELVRTSVEQGWTRHVLVDPNLVKHLETLRNNLGVPLAVNSGFRSPNHQRAVCQGICGANSCPGLCASYSRHSWGDAADLDLTTTSPASAAGFSFCTFHSGHLHVDTRSCGGGCQLPNL